MNLSAKIYARLPWSLASLRFFLLVSLSAIGLWFYHTPYSSTPSILLICTIVLLSDIFDGVLARKHLQSDMLYKFRCFDSIVDKIGLSIALLGLLASGRLPTIMSIFLLVREVILLLGGIMSAYYGHSIRGDNMGRIYYCVLFLMVVMVYPSDAPMISPITANLFGCTLFLLAIANLFSHGFDHIRHPYNLTV